MPLKNKLSFKHVSSVYQVNDKTIKEWLKTYKLPTTFERTQNTYIKNKNEFFYR